MSTLDIPVDVETADISSDLNSVILFIFLMGMYTVIYFGTIYVYFIKNPSRLHLVPVAITLLFLCSIAQTAFQWYTTKWQFIDNGDTRDSVFVAVINAPQWIFIGLDTLYCFTFAIADGLLIWRCYNVWNRSLRIIAVPLFFIIAEFALFLVEISFEAKYSSSNISPALAATLNIVLSAAFFVSFGTTLVTMLLVAYRIYSVSKERGPSSRLFKHIIDIVVQSGAVYALSQLATAIACVVPGSSNFFDKRVTAFQYYTQLLNVAVAGISATVMVARVALLSPDTTYPSTLFHLSGLQFHAHSTHPTVNIEAMEISHPLDGDCISEGEGQAVEGKLQ